LPLSERVMEPLAWLAAAGWGGLASLGLIVGALAGLFSPLEHRGIAHVMAVGAGVLLATASLDLTISAIGGGGPLQTALFLALGAGSFSLVNAWFARKGAKDRKRCGGCVQQATESTYPGSGLAVAIGTVLDSAPEGIVLGIDTARSGAPQVAVLLAFMLGNFPAALSATAGMEVAGRSRRYIFGVWVAAALFMSAVAALSAAFLIKMPAATQSCIDAFAAGALLSMTVETMIPEAAQEAAPFNGVLATGGFVALLLLLAVAK
jgi:zinc transporter, ZIP family